MTQEIFNDRISLIQEIWFDESILTNSFNKNQRKMYEYFLCGSDGQYS